MSNLVTIKNVRGYANEEGKIFVNLEDVARGLGFTRIATSGNECVRWERVEGYLVDIGYLVPCPQVGTIELPEFIPENIFYKLAMKASNETARKFQDVVCDEIPPVGLSDFSE